MPITKTVQATNGITITYHKPIRLEVDLVSDIALVTVNSHPSEQAALDGLPVAWQWRVNLPAAHLAGDQPTLAAEVEAALIDLAESPFFGGQVVADASDSLEAAKARAWTAVKVARSAAVSGNFRYDEGMYQADMGSILSAYHLATLAKANGTEYAETMTLADNTTRSFNADQVIALGVALFQNISSVHATSRALREQINQAETIEAVTAIGWPV